MRTSSTRSVNVAFDGAGAEETLLALLHRNITRRAPWLRHGRPGRREAEKPGAARGTEHRDVCASIGVIVARNRDVSGLAPRDAESATR